MSTLAGELLIKMGLDVAQLRRDVADSKRMSQEMANSWKSSMELAKTAVAGFVAAFSADKIQSFVKAQIDALDSINDLEKRTGMAAQALIELQGAAQRAGESTEGLDALMSKLPKKLAEAADATSPLGQQFMKLGLDAKAGLTDMNGFLVSFGETLKGMTDGGDKAALAVEVLGKGGDKFIGTLEGLAEMKARYKELGIIIDENAVAAADRFNDTLQDVADLSNNTGRQLVSGLLPGLNDIVTAFVDAKKAGLDFTSIGASIGNFLRATAGEALAVGAAFSRMGAEIKAAFNLITDGGLAKDAVAKYAAERDRIAGDFKAKVYTADSMVNGSQVFGGDLPTGETVAKRRAAGFLSSAVSSSKGGSSEAEKIAKAQKEALQSAERRLAVMGEESAVASTYFEMTSGKYREFDLATRTQLMTYAKITDERKRFLEQEARISAKEYDLGKEMQKVADSEAAQRRADVDKVASILGQTATAQQEEKARLQSELDRRFFDSGSMTAKQYAEATALLQGLTTEAKKTKDIFEELGATFESAFEKAISGGATFSDFMSGLGKDLAKIFAREFITGPIMKNFKDMLAQMKTEVSTAGSAPSSGGSGIAGLISTGYKLISAVFGGGQGDAQTSDAMGAQVKSVTNIINIDSRSDAAFVRANVEQGMNSVYAKVADAGARNVAGFAR